MRAILVFSLLVVPASAAQAGGLRFRVVDADSGAPIAGATVERWASQWQPCTIPWFGARRVWFPSSRVTTDSQGFASLDSIARDDWYAVKKEGYEQGSVKRGWLKFQFTARAGGVPQDMAEQSDALLVPLRRGNPKARNPQPN